MAISLIAVGGWATGTTSLSVAYPAGIQAGDLLVLAIANKYPTNSPSVPTDWVIPANGQQSGGSGTDGIDTGNVYATIMVKIATGSESGSLTVNITSGNSAVAEMALYRKAADKSWEYVCTNGSDNSAGTSWSVTGAANPGITAGDRMFTCSGINTDSYTFSSHALSATGVTFGALQADGSGTSGGEDCYCVLTDHVVSSGTASAAPTFTMSASGTVTNNPAGATVIMRMREVNAGYTLTADAGSYTLSGQAVALKTTRRITASTGSYTLTGNSAGVASGRKVAGLSGAYSLTGNTANLTDSRKIIAQAGSYLLTGITANLTSTRKLIGEAGIYNLTGNNTVLAFGRKLIAVAGGYSMTGIDADLVYEPPGAFILMADVGTYTIGGQPASLKTDRNFTTESGAYVLSGNAAGLSAARIIVAANGTYIISGSDGNLIGSRGLQAAFGVYSITGKDISLIYSEDGTPVININLSSKISSTIIANSQISNNFTGTSTIYNLVNI